MNKKTYLFIIALLSVALCVSVTFNLTGKTEASAAPAAPVEKAKVSKKAAKLSTDIIDDINSEFNGTMFQVASYDSGRLTLNFRQDIGGGLFANKIIYVDDVDVDNDVSYE